MAYDATLNPFTGKLQLVLNPDEVLSHSQLSDMPDATGTNGDHDLRYLKLDQSTPQTLTASPIITGFTNGAIPYFNIGQLDSEASSLNYNAVTNTLYADYLSTTALTLLGWTEGSVLFAGATYVTEDTNFNFVTGTNTLNVPNIISSGTVNGAYLTTANLSLNTNVITSDTGLISFNDDNLSTTGNIGTIAGTLGANTMTLGTGSITDSTGAISFGDENLSTTGTFGAGAITGTSITDSGLTEGRVPYVSTAGLLADEANFTWNTTNKELTIQGDLDLINENIGSNPYYGINYYTFDAGGLTSYPLINLTNARGTYASPSEQWSSRPLGGYSVQSWNGAAYEDFYKQVTWVGNATTSSATRSSKTQFIGNRSGSDILLMTLNGFASSPGVAMGTHTDPSGSGTLSVANTSGNANMIFQSASNWYTMGTTGTYFSIQPNAYFNSVGFLASNTTRNVILGYANPAYIGSAMLRVMDVSTTDPVMEIVTSANTGTQKMLKGVANWNVEKWYIDSGGNAQFDGTVIPNALTVDTTTLVANASGYEDRVGIGTATPAQLLDVNGITILRNALYLTQTDGNEYIDSLADGYTDIGATTGIRLNSPLTRVTGDLYVGNNAAADPAVVFDGDTNDGQITYKEDEDYFLSSSPIQLPYLAGAPATLTNGMMWMESDGFHIYYNNAEKTVAGA